MKESVEAVEIWFPGCGTRLVYQDNWVGPATSAVQKTYKATYYGSYGDEEIEEIVEVSDSEEFLIVGEGHSFSMSAYSTPAGAGRDQTLNFKSSSSSDCVLLVVRWAAKVVVVVADGNPASSGKVASTQYKLMTTRDFSACFGITTDEAKTLSDRAEVEKKLRVRLAGI